MCTEVSGPDFLISCQSDSCIISCRPARRNGDRCKGRSVGWERINMALRLSGCKLLVLRVPLASGRLGRTDGRTAENCDAQQKYGERREGTPKTEMEHERGAADRDDRANDRERTNAAGVSPNLIRLNGTVRRKRRHLIPSRGPRFSDNCAN